MENWGKRGEEKGKQAGSSKNTEAELFDHSSPGRNSIKLSLFLLVLLSTS